MLLTLFTVIAFIFEEEHWWNYPGFELWKFINLAIFVPVFIWFLNHFLGVRGALRNRKEQIRIDLDRARKERDAALAKLKEVEDRLSRLDTEVAAIQEQHVQEAAEERERIAKSTEAEIAKLGEQATREIESAGKVAKHELRRFAAEQSVRMAEQMIRREMKPEDDQRLITQNIKELGGPAQ
jgi:F0F1-type ATP synthase membrane subunit b/b'